MGEFKNLAELLNKSQAEQPKSARKKTSSTLEKEIARAQKIKNDNAVSDQKMKEKSLDWLFRMLVVEVIGIFIIALFQGFGSGDAWFKFCIEEWCFRVLVTGVFVQIATMVLVAIHHLFPTNNH